MVKKDIEPKPDRIDITKGHKDFEKYGELWNADPKCKHELLYGNGVRCVKCGGWCCY